MHEIEKVAKKKKRYEGKKAKLIHLHPDTFEILNTVAKRKNLKLKKYLELLCFLQAKYEAKLFLKEYEKKN